MLVKGGPVDSHNKVGVMLALDVFFDGIIYIPVAPFTNNGLTLIPAWISNYMSGKVWDEMDK